MSTRKRKVPSYALGFSRDDNLDLFSLTKSYQEAPPDRYVNINSEPRTLRAKCRNNQELPLDGYVAPINRESPQERPMKRFRNDDPDEDLYSSIDTHPEPPRKKSNSRLHAGDTVGLSARQLRAPQQKQRDCMICCEPKLQSWFPDTYHENEEQGPHVDEVCLDCWRIHLQTQVESTSPDQIKCPQCSVLLAEPEIRELADRATYNSYVEKATLKLIKQDPLFRSCPSTDCSYGYIHTTNDDGNIFRCELCQARYCTVCEVTMHEEETCDAYQARLRDQQGETRKQEAASQVYLESNSKMCPKCGIHIQKNDGCDHMTCRVCRNEFCWICLCPYDGSNGIRQRGNGAHRTGCRYLPTNLPSIAPEVADGRPAGERNTVRPNIGAFRPTRIDGELLRGDRPATQTTRRRDLRTGLAPAPVSTRRNSSTTQSATRRGRRGNNGFR